MTGIGQELQARVHTDDPQCWCGPTVADGLLGHNATVGETHELYQPNPRAEWRNRGGTWARR